MRFQEYNNLEDWMKYALIDYANEEDKTVYWEFNTEDLKEGWEKEAKIYKAMWEELKTITKSDEIKTWMNAIEKTYGIKGDE